MDPLSIAAGALSVAGGGLKLAQTLYEYAESVNKAGKWLKPVADHVRLTSAVLKNLGALLKKEDIKRLYTHDLLKSTHDALDGCKGAFEDLDTLVKSLLRPDKSGKLTLTITAKLMLSFRQNELDVLQAHLERFKSNLDLVLGVLNLASSAKGARDKAELLGLKLEVQKLMVAQHTAQKREDLITAAVNSQVHPDSKNAKPDDKVESPGPPPYISVDTAIASKTTAKAVVPRSNPDGAPTIEQPEPLPSDDALLFHLSKCAQAVEKLAATIEEVTTQWHQKRHYERQCIAPAFQTTRQALGQLSTCELDLDFDHLGRYCEEAISKVEKPAVLGIEKAAVKKASPELLQSDREGPNLLPKLSGHDSPEADMLAKRLVELRAKRVAKSIQPQATSPVPPEATTAVPAEKSPIKRKPVIPPVSPYQPTTSDMRQEEITASIIARAAHQSESRSAMLTQEKAMRGQEYTDLAPNLQITDSLEQHYGTLYDKARVSQTAESTTSRGAQSEEEKRFQYEAVALPNATDRVPTTGSRNSSVVATDESEGDNRRSSSGVYGSYKYTEDNKQRQSDKPITPIQVGPIGAESRSSGKEDPKAAKKGKSFAPWQQVNVVHRIFRYRKHRHAERADSLRMAVDEYSYNPNADPTLPHTSFRYDAYEQAPNSALSTQHADNVENHPLSYRGWGYNASQPRNGSPVELPAPLSMPTIPSNRAHSQAQREDATDTPTNRQKEPSADGEAEMSDDEEPPTLLPRTHSASDAPNTRLYTAENSARLWTRFEESINSARTQAYDSRSPSISDMQGDERPQAQRSSVGDESTSYDRQRLRSHSDASQFMPQTSSSYGPSPSYTYNPQPHGKGAFIYDEQGRPWGRASQLPTYGQHAAREQRTFASPLTPTTQQIVSGAHGLQGYDGSASEYSFDTVSEAAAGLAMIQTADEGNDAEQGRSSSPMPSGAGKAQQRAPRHSLPEFDTSDDSDYGAVDMSSFGGGYGVHMAYGGDASVLAGDGNADENGIFTSIGSGQQNYAIGDGTSQPDISEVDELLKMWTTVDI